MPPNYFANNLLVALVLSSDSETKCFLCDNCDAGDPAETRCEECEIFICHFCSEYHRRSHATKSHVLVSVSDLTSSEPSAIAKRLQCEKHKEEMNLYCQTCEMTICRECIIADHREHKYSKIQDVSEEEKNNLQKVLDSAMAQKARIASGISYVQMRAEHVNAKQESTIEEIRKSFEGLTVMIENRKEELVERANSSTALKLEQLREQSNRLKNTLDTYESSIDFIQQAFQSGNDAQILNMKKYISRRLTELQCLYSQTQPCVDEYMEFRNDLSVKDIEEKIVRSCSILDEKVSPERCTASFKESQKYLKPGKQSVITLVCKDICNIELKRGGLSITPIFSGVRVKDVTVTDTNDGSYDVSFVVLDTGTLQFKANVCGKPASGCNLHKNVLWEISNVSGLGSITNEGSTMEGQRASMSYRVGDRSFDCGIHSWVVNVTGENPYNKDNDGTTFLVGVIDDTEDISANGTGQAQTWVYNAPARLLANVAVELDMNKKSLSVKPTLKTPVLCNTNAYNYRNLSFYTTCRPTYCSNLHESLDKSQKVLPYFGVNSPYFTLSLVDKRSQTTVAKEDEQPATASSLINAAGWKISKSSGTGIVDYHGLSMVGENFPCCFWIGDCSFHSGLHTWKVEVTKASQYYAQKGSNCCIEVGVVEDTAGDNSTESIRKAKKWVHRGSAELVRDLSVKLDMTSRQLKIKPTAHQSNNRVSPLIAFFDAPVTQVYPYFSVNSTDYVLSLTQRRSSFF